MTEQKFDELFEEYSRIESPVERAKISYLLHGKIAADQENKTPDIEKIGTSMGENWMAAAENFEKILKEDPDQAFKIAVQLTTLPVSSDQKIEDINKWLRGDGPGMLGRDDLRGDLLKYLANAKTSDKLIGKLGEYVSFDFSKVRDGKSAFDNPNCYLSLSSILLGLKMGKDVGSSENASKLFEQANSKFKDPEVKRVIDYYRELPDTKWLADELNSFKVK